MKSVLFKKRHFARSLLNGATILLLAFAVPGCSMLFGGKKVFTVSVPDSLAPVGDLNFEGKNMIDGQATTAWQTSKPVGKAVILQLSEESDVSNIRIKNGHHWVNHPKYGDLWTSNARIKKASLFVNGVYRKTLEFSSVYSEWDEFDIDADDANTISVKIESVYPGAKWNDLAISEIEVR
ncbi:MAG: hypothetical protein CMN76_16985 [Spirochaetaceae bacterium]|nr:hypothetical protein [Spirochaetaceae bacterium]